MLKIPLTSDPAQLLTVKLGGTMYGLALRYNDRSASWTFDLTVEASQRVLLSGVPLLLGQDLLAPYGLEIGGLTVTDRSRLDLDAGPDDLGDRVQLVWLSPQDVADLATVLAQIHAGDLP